MRKKERVTGLNTDVLAFLEQEPLLRVQATQWMKQGRGEVLAQVRGGAVIRDRVSGVPMLCADTVEIALSLLPNVPRIGVMVCDLAMADGAVMERMGYPGRESYHNYVYLSDMPLPEEGELRLLPMPVENAVRVSEHYHIHTLSELAEDIRAGRLLGGYAGGEWVGFIGWHEEGSMGMLHVFEQYRRRGYGRAMEARLVNLTLLQGLLPYGQVSRDNMASAKLQESLGFTRCEKTVSWLFWED